MRTSLRLAPAIAGLAMLGLVAACGDSPVTTAPAADAPAPSDGVLDAQTPVDIDGTWDWHEVGKFNLTEEAAALFGVTPEGPQTQIRCESGGTLTLVQAGDSFTGSATQSSLCESKGGQVFVPLAFPPGLDVVDGRISGRHVAFIFGAGPIPCKYKATARVDGGAVVALVGTGGCITPGHPQSPLPVPPPPLGPGQTIEWIATR